MRPQKTHFACIIYYILMWLPFLKNRLDSKQRFIWCPANSVSYLQLLGAVIGTGLFDVSMIAPSKFKYLTPKSVCIKMAQTWQDLCWAPYEALLRIQAIFQKM